MGFVVGVYVSHRDHEHNALWRIKCITGHDPLLREATVCTRTNTYSKHAISPLVTRQSTLKNGGVAKHRYNTQYARQTLDAT